MTIVVFSLFVSPFFVVVGLLVVALVGSVGCLLGWSARGRRDWWQFVVLSIPHFNGYRHR